MLGKSWRHIMIRYYLISGFKWVDQKYWRLRHFSIFIELMILVFFLISNNQMSQMDLKL